MDAMTLLVAAVAAAAIFLIAIGIATSSPRPELNKLVEQRDFGANLSRWRNRRKS